MIFNYKDDWFSEEEKLKLGEIIHRFNTSDSYDKNIVKDRTYYNDGLIRNDKDHRWLFHTIDNFVTETVNAQVIKPINFISLLKYNVGDYLGVHQDYLKNGRLLIVGFLFNEEFEGGILRMHDPIYDVPPKLGSIYLFDVYRPHEVTPVTKGVRYSGIAAYSVENLKVNEINKLI
jgi:hypothetical protein